MAVRSIHNYPAHVLREVAEPVGEIDDEIRVLVEDMAETMYAANGVGLAANQIGVLKRVFVIDIAADDEPSALTVFINPEITDSKGTQSWEEGCLSFPGATAEVKRAETIHVRALDAEGNSFEMEADGLMAVALQHENDHLDGVLMIDKVNAIKKHLIARKVEKALAEE